MVYEQPLDTSDVVLEQNFRGSCSGHVIQPVDHQSIETHRLRKKRTGFLILNAKASKENDGIETVLGGKA